MSDPAEAVQRALYAALSTLGTEAGARVFDSVPENALFPYVTIGEDQILPVDEDCFDPSEIFAQIDVWTREIGFPQNKRIAGAIRTRLHHGDLEIVGHVVDLIEVRSVNYLRDPDGITRHGVINVMIRTQPA